MFIRWRQRYKNGRLTLGRVPTSLVLKFPRYRSCTQRKTVLFTSLPYSPAFPSFSFPSHETKRASVGLNNLYLWPLVLASLILNVKNLKKITKLRHFMTVSKMSTNVSRRAVPLQWPSSLLGLKATAWSSAWYTELGVDRSTIDSRNVVSNAGHPRRYWKGHTWTGRHLQLTVRTI